MQFFFASLKQLPGIAVIDIGFPTNLNELGQLPYPTPVPVTGVRVYGCFMRACIQNPGKLPYL
jgi:hypothetical protein